MGPFEVRHYPGGMGRFPVYLEGFLQEAYIGLKNECFSAIKNLTGSKYWQLEFFKFF